MIKYKTVVTFIGKNVDEMMKNNLLILFDNNAPEELKTFCILHSKSELEKEVKVHDRLLIDNQVYTITAVGDVANKNLKDLGHVVLNFNGSTNPELPGYIHLAPCLMNKIKAGTKLEIIEEDL